MNIRIPFSIIALVLIFVSMSCVPNKNNSNKTTVSIEGEMFLINGKPTYEGRYWQGNKVEGLLFNSRMVQGVFDDENPETKDRFKYPDTDEWSADRNTNEFVENMPLWKSYGLNSFTINLQGGSPTGYGNKGCINTAFDEKGNLKPAFLERLSKILDKANELEMVVILGYFYFGQDQFLEDEQAIINGVKNATKWVLTQGYQNVIVEINNECNVKSYDHEILKAERVHELIELAKSINIDGRRLLVSTSYKGCFVPLDNVVKCSDFILLHGNGAKPSKIKYMVEETKKVEGYKGQPLVFNEDDNYNFSNEVNNFKVAVENYASWGYFDFRRVGKQAQKAGIEDETDIQIGYQSVPVDWGISHTRKQEFFEYLKEISGI